MDETAIRDIEKLWQDYKASGAEELRNEIIYQYLPQVRYIAERLLAKLPKSFELEDLIQAGVFGLIDAARGFDPTRGVKFETYCTMRIRGAILDHLRSLDWVPRLVRTRAAELHKLQNDLERELGRLPTEFEMAERLGGTLDEYSDLLQEAAATSIVSLTRTKNENEENKTLRKIDILEDKKGPNPLANLERKELMELMTKGLSKKERLIVILYYYEELTMREIGAALDLSESRVCQIHSRIILRLKSQLAKLRQDLMS
ncbi:MAG: FliA/WhiG family RNA polymerase sigma factor [Planctomycetes bacterium]|nr:FliA/WhiG family RNA polymerase sigma factor [Planctomycetota bacterium]